MARKKGTAKNAVKARIYPNHHQAALLDAAFVECVRWYNIHLEWFKSRREPCEKQFAAFCASHKGDDAACKEFMKGLPWPSTSKMGWPKSIVHPNERYEKRFGKIKFVAFNMMNEAVEDDLGKAIETTRHKSCVRFASAKKRHTFCVVIKHLDSRVDAKGVKQIRIPFLSPKGMRKTEPETEWFDCRLSNDLLNTSTKQTSITVTRNHAGEYFAAIRVEQPKVARLDTGVECGVDIGVKTALVVAYNAEGETSSDYDKHAGIDIDKKTIDRIEKTIEHLQKTQSRRIKTWLRVEQSNGEHMDLTMHGKGCHSATAVYMHYKSNAFKETEHRLAQLNLKLRDIRKDFHEKTSRKLRDTADTIGLENLNVKGMLHNHCLARSVSRIGFYGMRTAIERKFGIENVRLIDRFSPSSKTCSKCGHVLTKEERSVIGFDNGARGLKVRRWTCPNCGAEHDRDENAASNIRPSIQGRNLSNENSVVGHNRCTGDSTDKTAETINTLPIESAVKSRESKDRKRKEAVPDETSASAPIEREVLACSMWESRRLDGRQLSLFELIESH